MWYFSKNAAREPHGEQLLHLSQYARVYRRELVEGAGRVVCKELLGPKALQRFRHERRILERLAGLAGVPRLVPGELPPCTIALEDLGDLSLGTLASGRALEMQALLELGQRLGGIISALHGCGVAHRNLTPDNVMVLGAGRRPVLIGFGLATTCAEERPGFVHHREIAGTLGYLAPEQTGRTGRSVDQRADLYSLGAILYRLATGSLPFPEGDPLQLIHDMLTRVPTPPAELDPQLPEEFSDLIMRLLEKEPDRRYQSAQGVLHDLSRLDRAPEPQGGGAFHGLWGKGAGEAVGFPARRGFSLGERDFPPRLSPPSRLIGRDREISLLRIAFDAALDGTGCGVLVAGAAGVGKSALIGELRPMVTARRGFFVAGKFDQQRSDLASDAVYQALRALGRLLLAEPEEELALLRDRILQALGPGAGLISTFQPEFATILGAAPGSAGYDPLKDGPRLTRATLDLLRVIASPQRPLVVVLDDLQWGAALPVGFVDAVLTEGGMSGLLLVCAYREAEVEPTHPLCALLARWNKLELPPLLLRLANLQPADLGLLLGEILRLQPEEAARLAGAVGARTDGNPYDTVELINSLRCDGALVQEREGWSWNPSTIRRHVGRGDVVELLAGRIDRLPPGARELLGIMACLGGEVELLLLQCASDLSSAALEEELYPALEDGLLVLERAGDGAVRFRHDRVQQAAYGRLDGSELSLPHLTLARRLAAHPEFASLAAEQFLPASDALHDPAERRRVAGLFQGAAAAARLVNAAGAERFLAAALTLLTRVADQADASRITALQTERHAVLVSLARLEEADAVYRSLELGCAGPLELSGAAWVQVSSLTYRSRPQEAVELGVDLLRRLGLSVPGPDELGVTIERGMDLFTRWVDDDGVADDLRRPEADDPCVTAAARLLNRMLPPAFFCGLAITPWLVLESQRLWAEHGPCAALVGPLSHASFVTIAVRQDYRTGHRAVRRLLAVSETRGYQSEISQARFLFSLSAGPWCEPLEESILLAQRAREGLLLGGNLQDACFSYYTTIPDCFDCLPTLEGCAGEIESGYAFAVRTGNAHAALSFDCYLQLVRLLRSESGTPGSFSEIPGAHPSGADARSTTAALHHTTRALAGAIFGDAAELRRHADAAMDLVPFVEACYLTSEMHLLLALALAGEVRACATWERAVPLARLDTCRDWLAGRSADAPGNFLHLVTWVTAERAWALDDPWSAAGAFDAALCEVQALRRPWHRALITERAALFHLERGLEHAGRNLLAQARQHYAGWGAVAKLRQLEQSYPFLRLPVAPPRDGESRHSVCADAIDMLAILRASQALSSETSLERLRAQVSELLRTMTGATAVSLLLWQEAAQDWALLPPAGEGGAAVPLGEAGLKGLLPLSVVRYAVRTRETLLVEDAKADDRFCSDPYLQGCQRCSLLVVPVLSQGVPRAMLLLENGMSRGAFAADRLDVVQLIAGQLAVSLENALLYEELEERVRERTRELQEAQSELLALARQAGMAEVASNVLHNVGNVLNSVNISAGLVTGKLNGSKLPGLAKAVLLMEEHARDLGGYLDRDEKGRLLPGYLKKLSGVLVQENRAVVEELARLMGSVDHIKEIVATQQSYAGSASFLEPVRIGELVRDALRINAEALTRHEVSVVQECAELPVLLLDRARLLQILVNLVSNAKHAMVQVADRTRPIILRVETAPGAVLRISVADPGEGIAPENLARVFAHGFTTRRGGHGFGLHSCALAAREMGGTLTASSDGPGQGATFTLELPMHPENVKGTGA